MIKGNQNQYTWQIIVIIFFNLVKLKEDDTRLSANECMRMSEEKSALNDIYQFDTYKWIGQKLEEDKRTSSDKAYFIENNYPKEDFILL